MIFAISSASGANRCCERLNLQRKSSDKISTYTINDTPTAASATVGGRVMSSSGRGIARARVSISNSAGETRTVQSNLFGYYQFQNVITGETYVVNVQAKRYSFEPTLVLISNDLTDLNFMAQN